MCGRYEVIDGKRVFTRFKVPTQYASLFDDNLDIRPTNTVPAIVTDHELQLMRWGLIPSWAKDPKIGSKMFNARAETVAEKPSFKKALRFQRCIIPASAFFEWKGAPGAKVKQRIARTDGELFGFAGLYDTWKSPDGQSIATCTIITTTPNRVLAPIHNRMPVILLPDDEEAWLSPDLTEFDPIVSMLKPYPDDLLEAHVA
jgi:putative SOS response-associated peptidase YedK